MNGSFANFLIVAVVLYAFLKFAYPRLKRLARGKDVVYLPVETLAKQMAEKRDMLLIDIRTPQEFYNMFGHIDTANARQSGERFGYLRAGVLDLYAAQVDLLIVPADGDAVKLDRRGRRGRARRRRRRRCGRRRLIYYDGGGGRFVRAARAKNTKRGCGKE